MYLDIFFVFFVSVWGLLLYFCEFLNIHYQYFKEPTKHALNSPGIFEAITKL